MGWVSRTPCRLPNRQGGARCGCTVCFPPPPRKKKSDQLPQSVTQLFKLEMARQPEFQCSIKYSQAVKNKNPWTLCLSVDLTYPATLQTDLWMAYGEHCLQYTTSYHLEGRTHIIKFQVSNNFVSVLRHNHTLLLLHMVFACKVIDELPKMLYIVSKVLELTGSWWKIIWRAKEKFPVKPANKYTAKYV